MFHFPDITIRATLVSVIGALGLLVTGLSANALLNAYDEAANARRIATSTVISKQLFRSLTGLRNERGPKIFALLGDEPIGRDADAIAAAARAEYEAGYAEALKGLGSLERAPGLERLKAAHQAVGTLQSQVDAAVHQAKSARDPTLVQTWSQVTQSMLDANLAISDPLEAAIKLTDPLIDHYLEVKHAAWTARLNLGLAALKGQELVSAGQAMTDAEAVVWHQNMGRADGAWRQVTEAAARDDAPRALVEAVEKAGTSFTEHYADDMKALIDALAARRPARVDAEGLRKIYNENNAAVAAVSIVALDQMVSRAGEHATRANRILVADGAVLLAALALSVGGFLVVTRRVSRPIQTLTGLITRLARQDFTVEIPPKTYGDEVGQMQEALLVLRENGKIHRESVRVRAAEAKSRRLANLYAALSQCNQAIVHSANEADLFPKICRCVVEYGFAKMAWIGLLDKDRKRVDPIVSYGDTTGYMDGLTVPLDLAEPLSRAPSATSIRDNQAIWYQDLVRDFMVGPATQSWHERAKNAGFHGLASLPLHRNGIPAGCLVIYSDTTDAFDEGARELLIEMAVDISFALDNFARETERRQSVTALQASETRYRLVFQTSLDAIAINRMSDGTYVDVNDGFVNIMGFDHDDVIGRKPPDISIWVNPEDRRNLIETLRQALFCQNVEAQFRKKNGELLWGLISASLIELDDELCILSVTRDISDIKKAEEEIKTLAFYDPLTHLPNRRLLTDRLGHALAVAARNKRTCALLFVDLDNFKTLNDSSGHAIGDLMLQEVATRLMGNVRESDTVARLGGDEFIVLIEDLSENLEESATQAEDIGKKILDAIAQPYLLSGREYRSTTSIGVILFGKRYENSDDLLTQADIAMYQAKVAGRNTLRFFSPDLQAAINTRVAMEDDLHRAVGKAQFSLHYQPQVEHGHLVGAEALIRWNHPERGVVAPGQFIPLAEETGLILPLGQWVLETACRQIATWDTRKDTAHIVLAVNVSALQFRQPNFIEQTLSTLEKTGANPQKLKLELTESLLVDNIEDVIAKMTALRSRGVRFSLDDFGTGYSSLSYLKRLPLDQLKIDRSFVKDVLTDANDAAIAKTIVALGQTMGLSVIAEGVETEAQRGFLSGLGCHAYQGFLFGRPLPLEEFQMSLQSLAN
ncbi:EAL domain-containing protein [Telmatospirillum siberiense]|uniref:Diguanylate cyclase n=1 Tax=Telmatospirillum siberiense TaxID=382514 RepID=A0A2N3PQ09_9PROT|nr:EAL domain-containing protein [Telmatospirillum siberiense]PKU22484.1 diguanylate cyclase [Telmatospirillum siberiense]